MAILLLAVAALPARLRAAARDALGRAPRRRRSCSRSTPRARWARPTSRRRGSPRPRPRPAGSSPTCPKQVPRRRRRLQLARAGRGGADADRAVRELGARARCASGRARRSATALATAVKVATRHAARRRSRPPGTKPPPAADPRSSPTARRTADASSSPTPIAPGARGQGPRLHGAARHARPASSRCRTSAATSSASRCRPTRRAARAWPRRRAAASSRRRRRTTSSPVYADLKSRLGTTHKDEEITVAFAGAGALLLLGGCALSALWFRRVP